MPLRGLRDLCGLLVFSAALAIASAVGVAHDRITTKVSWTRDIAPIVEARCVRCHRPDGRGPMALTTYEEARPWARAIREEVLARRMPKWHAVRGYGDFANDPSLSPFEIALIVAWVDGGAPKHLPGEGLNVAAKSPVVSTFGRTVTQSRQISFPCHNPPRLTGRLIAVRPQLDDGGSVGITVRHPGGAQDIVAWIRGFESDFAETYWLRNAIPLTAASRLQAQSAGTCRLTIWIDAPSSRQSPQEPPPVR